MSNRCPKCNEKLSPLYMKQTCPKCDTNLVYYDLDKRLEADHIQAMKEQEAVDKVLNNIKTSAFGGPVQIIRSILMFSPLVWMCFPMFDKVEEVGSDLVFIDLSLLELIKSIIANVSGADNGAIPLDMWFSDKEYLFALITIACIIIFSLIEIISSLFSIGKNALKRNMTLHAINHIAYFVMSCIPIHGSFGFSFGLSMIGTLYILMYHLHKDVHKKLNQ